MKNTDGQAIHWVKQIEKENGGATLSLGKAVKNLLGTKAVLAADPQLQVDFVRHVVAVFGKLGARKKRIPQSSAWFHKKNVPVASEEVMKLLLRRRLPFTDDMLAEMLEQIAGMDFVTFAPALESLIRALEVRAAGGLLPPRICRAAARVADGLVVKDWPAADADNWGLPGAADRKLAARIETLLTGR